jgi:hypothetical protein
MIHLVHVHDIDAVELARQITVMETNLFCRIRPNEMIGQEFKKRSGKNTAIHVKAMIQRSTQITNWVCDTILKENDTRKRVQMLKYWIKVGDVSFIYSAVFANLTLIYFQKKNRLVFS